YSRAGAGETPRSHAVDEATAIAAGEIVVGRRANRSPRLQRFGRHSLFHRRGLNALLGRRHVISSGDLGRRLGFESGNPYFRNLGTEPSAEVPTADDVAAS